MSVMLFLGFLCLTGAVTALVVLLRGSHQVALAPTPQTHALEVEPAESAFTSLARRAGGLARRMTAADYPARLQHRLDVAGNPRSWPVSRVLTLKGVGLVAGLLLGFLYGVKIGGLGVVVAPAVCALAGFFLPDVWIRNLGQRRQQDFRKTLPDVIDMMTVCVEAGLGFDAALTRVSTNLHSPAAAEFSRLLQEMQLGKSRAEALRDAASRTDVAEFRAFVSSVVQSSELGISIGDVLRAQAGQMRIKRRQRAEEAAMKLPVKILGPLMLFILPAMFIVIMGPAVINIMQSFSAAGR